MLIGRFVGFPTSAIRSATRFCNIGSEHKQPLLITSTCALNRYLRICRRPRVLKKSFYIKTLVHFSISHVLLKQ